MKVLFGVCSQWNQTSSCWLTWTFPPRGAAAEGARHSWRLPCLLDRVCMCGHVTAASYEPSYYYLWPFYHFRGLGRWNRALWLRSAVVWLGAGRLLTSVGRVDVWGAGRKEVTCWALGGKHPRVSWISLNAVLEMWEVFGEFVAVLRFPTSSFDCREQQKDFKISKTLNFRKLVDTSRLIKFTFFDYIFFCDSLIWHFSPQFNWRRLFTYKLKKNGRSKLCLIKFGEKKISTVLNIEEQVQKKWKL